MKNLKTSGSDIAAALSKAVSAHTTADKGARYSDLSGAHSHMRAFTIAAFIAAGMVSLSPKGTATAGKNPKSRLWAKLVGPRAVSHWGAKGRVKDGKLTTAGLNTIQDSLSGNTRGYNTDMETVKKFSAVIAKGGTVTIDKRTYKVATIVTA